MRIYFLLVNLRKMRHSNVSWGGKEDWCSGEKKGPERGVWGCSIEVGFALGVYTHDPSLTDCY